MKRPIIACIALACLTPLSNAVVLYDTMTGNGYDEFYSPTSWLSGTTNQVAVDDVTLAFNAKITSISFRLLTDNLLNVGDTLQGYLYIYGSNGLGNLDPSAVISDTGNGLKNFTVTQANSGFIVFDYAFDVNNLSNIDLNAGKYWFGMQVYSTDPNVSAFNIAGDNYGEGLNTMIYDGSSWAPFQLRQRGTDLSMKIEGQELGEPVVPGPAAILPFGIGLAAALRRRRK